MNRRTITLALGATALLCLGVALPGSAVAQQKSLKEQLIGTWTLVSNDNTLPDGTKRQIFGANPKGILILDAGGRYAQTSVRTDLPKFKSNNRLEATPEESKAAFVGTLAHFGTWAVNEGDKTITLHFEGSLNPNATGMEEKRAVGSVTADELKWTNPASNTGGKTETVYRRAK